MLGGKSEKGKKTTVGLISKKGNSSRAAHLLYISLTLFCTTTT